MIIICGAGSALAKNAIEQLSKNQKVIAISRNAMHQGDNITNLNLNNYNELPDILKNINSNNLTFINFVGHSNKDLLINVKNDDLRQDYELNFELNFKASKILIPKMIDSKYGRFIFISSSGAHYGDVGIFSYSHSKRANITLQKQIVNEYSRFGITSNILLLGFYNTNMWQGLSDKIKKDLLDKVPSNKLSDPLCIAPTIDMIIKYPSINNNLIKLDDGF